MISDVLAQALEGMGKFLDDKSLARIYDGDVARELETLRASMKETHKRLTNRPSDPHEKKVNRWLGKQESKLQYENGRWYNVSRSSAKINERDLNLAAYVLKYDIK